MLKIDTAAIRSTASTIAAQNEQLYETLEASKSTVGSLAGIWTGAAADATISAYNNFAANYFNQYREMLDNYVAFLNKAAGEGYDETERAVTRKADQL